MKKLLLLLLVFPFIISCSSDDEEESTLDEYRLQIGEKSWVGILFTSEKEAETTYSIHTSEGPFLDWMMATQHFNVSKDGINIQLINETPEEASFYGYFDGDKMILRYKFEGSDPSQPPLIFTKK